MISLNQKKIKEKPWVHCLMPWGVGVVHACMYVCNFFFFFCFFWIDIS